jgi:hypothetical protein
MVAFKAGGFHSDGRSVFWREGFSVFFLTQIIFTVVIKKLIIRYTIIHNTVDPSARGISHNSLFVYFPCHLAFGERKGLQWNRKRKVSICSVLTFGGKVQGPERKTA